MGTGMYITAEKSILIKMKKEIKLSHPCKTEHPLVRD